LVDVDKFCKNCGTPIPVAYPKPEASDSFESSQQQIRPGVIAGVAGAVVVIGLIVLGLIGGWFSSKENDTSSDDRAMPSITTPSAPDSAPGSPFAPAPRPEPAPAPPPTPQPEPALPPPTPEPEPQPQEPPPVEEPVALSLDEVILTTYDWIKLSINWDNGTLTVFERDRGSPVWTMQSRDGNTRIVEPNFAYEGAAFTFGFPTTNEIYRLFPNNTGNYGREGMVWSYETDPIYYRGSSYGAFMTYDLDYALSNYELLVIRVYWNNGDITIFYKQANGLWLMRGRNGSFSSVAPRFSSDTSVIYISFPNSASNYVLFDDGTGMLGNDEFVWYYNYSDR